MKFSAAPVPFDMFGSLTGHAHTFANYGNCNHGPSRFYRTNMKLRAFNPDLPTVLRDWRGRLCTAPETTTVCATNGDTFATYHWDWCSYGDHYATANYDSSNVCH